MPHQLLDFAEIDKIKKKLIQTKTPLDDHARLIYQERYLKPGLNNKLESIEERLASVAVDIASADWNYLEGDHKDKLAKIEELSSRIYMAMAEKRFLFNTPTIMNFGRFKKKDGKILQEKQMGSACFVLPIEDSFGDEEPGDGILDQVKYQGLIHKSGGGTGFSFSRLRPAGSIIGHDPKEIGKRSTNWGSSTGISSGPLSFLKYLYDQETNAIKQGNSRRGANMGVQRIDHPDFLDHLYAKFGTSERDKESQIVNFNLSLAVTDEFMRQSLENRYFKLYNPFTKRYQQGHDLCTQERFEEILLANKVNPYNPLTLPSLYLKKNSSDVVNAYTGEIIGFDDGDCIKINARKILYEIARIASANGEPGIIFIDRMNEFNPTPHLGEIEATNPCGEQPLLPYEACNLASINLSRFVVYKNNGQDDVPELDYTALGDAVELLVHALDNVIDRSDFPLNKITEAVNKTRKIGLGIMGFADMLIKLEIPYNSPEAAEFSEKIAYFIYEKSKAKSVELAGWKGIFPAYPGSIYDKTAKCFLKDKPMNYDMKLRNAAITTVAPTGTISRLSETSSGIEPTFSLIYQSKIMNRVLDNVSYGFIEFLKHKNLYSPEILDAVKKNGGSIRLTDETPKEVKAIIARLSEKYRQVLQTATDGQITAECHLNIQAAFQKYNDSSISKTVTLIAGSGVEDVLATYFNAWEKGLKGVTIYIDKSRQIQVLNTAEGIKEPRKNGSYRRPLAQESYTIELPIGDPLKKPGEFEEKSEVVFTTIAFDRIEQRVNSIFQNMSFGSSHELIYLIAQNKAWSRLLKISAGDLSLLEKELRGLPRAHHEGAISEDNTFRTQVANDTIPNAALKTVLFMKFITEEYKNWDRQSMDKRYTAYRTGKVLLKDIIKFEGSVKLDNNGGLPSLLPKTEILKFNNNILTPKICPYCKRENPPFHLEESCMMYDCCGQSKCS